MYLIFDGNKSIRRCAINSEPEKDELESLLDAMGMDSILSQLLTEMSVSSKRISHRERSSCAGKILCGSEENGVKVEVDNNDPPGDGHDTPGDLDSPTPETMGHKRKLSEIETECRNQKCQFYVNMNQDNHLSNKSNFSCGIRRVWDLASTRSARFVALPSSNWWCEPVGGDCENDLG